MMRKRTLAVTAAGFLLLALFAIGMLPRGGAHVAALTNCSTTEEAINAAEQQMLTLINGARASAGLGALKLSPNLNRAAAWKSADNGSNGLGTGFSHTDSLGRDPSARARACGYASSAAENIAYGSTSPEAIFGLGAAPPAYTWMGSPMHRANILHPGYKVIGIGQHGAAWTTDFGFLDDSGAAPPPPPPANTATPTSVPSATPTSTPTRTPSPTATAVPVSLAGISVPLSAGMNLLAYGGLTQPVASALRSLHGYVQAVYEWDAANGAWEKYAPDGPGYVNSFTTLTTGSIYYIQVSTDVTWSY